MNIREERMADHFTKFHIEGLPFAAVLHHFTQPDHGPGHDHPWNFRSMILSGGYVEEVFALDGSSEIKHRMIGETHHVPAERIHRIIALPAGECWTLITPEPGPPRTSGFYEWRDGEMWHRFWHEREFTRVGTGGRVEVREAAE